MKFVSTDEALQYLADVTNKRIIVSTKMSEDNISKEIDLVVKNKKLYWNNLGEQLPGMASDKMMKLIEDCDCDKAKIILTIAKKKLDGEMEQHVDSIILVVDGKKKSLPREDYADLFRVLAMKFEFDDKK
jgi:hypothetical protein